MLNLVIGHRGTGKSSWLKIIKELYQSQNQKATCYDLDAEVEKLSGKSIKDLFSKSESVFRDLEQKAFKNIIDKINDKDLVYICAGAGFKFKKQENWNVILLSRFSDISGRVFLDRPALSDKDSFEEYHYFYKERQEYYLNQYDEEFSRPEHFEKGEFFDKLFLGLEKLDSNLFSLTLDPKKLPKNEKRLKHFLEKRLNWGIRFFEFHDESANQEFINTVQKFIPKDKILFSSCKSKLFCDTPGKIHWSWDLALGEPPKEASIVSIHDRDKQSLKDVLNHLSTYKNKHLKLAVEIYNLEELKQAYDWWKQDSKNRSFLPRSQDGRWKWFRNAFGSEMFLNFIREGDSKILDQPYFAEAIHFSKNKKALAAVIGFPIDFSATPYEHNSFFYKERSIPVLPVPLKEEELNRSNLKILQDIGFVFFAVTSPLKKKAFEVADKHSQEAKSLKSVNTLVLHQGKWHAYNTDIESIKEIKKQVRDSSIKVWGGSGVRPVFESVFPEASFYSARTGKIIKGQENSQSDILIWAVGRNRMKSCQWPPKDWTFSKILDLNYTEDSPGKELALETKAQYQKGVEFFKTQAKKQREIFLELEQQG